MIPADAVAAIAQRIVEHAGLALPAWVVAARAAARIALVGSTAEDYVALLDTPRGAGELAELIEAVRVGESRLFRHRPQIEALREAIVPVLAARGRAVRVWSAGCAAGEEPYTLAIVLSRALPDHAITIIATDVSGEALAQARLASFPRGQLAHVPEAYRDCFTTDGDAIRVVPEIAALVHFERANLLDGAAPKSCDLVWCRNVLIYFSADARRRAIDRIVGATSPGGFVFVGYSESLRDVAELDAVRARDAVYYVRRPDDAPVPRPRRQTAQLPAPVPVPAALSDDRTPPPLMLPPDPPPHDTIALRGHPAAARVVAELSARLGQPGLRSLIIDLDGAELLGDELAPVVRRAQAAARTAGIALVVHATRTGARRWLARHGIDDGAEGTEGAEGP